MIRKADSVNVCVQLERNAVGAFCPVTKEAVRRMVWRARGRVLAWTADIGDGATTLFLGATSIAQLLG
jgi:hypothetical protein